MVNPTLLLTFAFVIRISLILISNHNLYASTQSSFNQIDGYMEFVFIATLKYPAIILITYSNKIEGERL